MQSKNVTKRTQWTLEREVKYIFLHKISENRILCELLLVGEVPGCQEGPTRKVDASHKFNLFELKTLFKTQLYFIE